MTIKRIPITMVFTERHEALIKKLMGVFNISRDHAIEELYAEDFDIVEAGINIQDQLFECFAEVSNQ